MTLFLLGGGPMDRMNDVFDAFVGELRSPRVAVAILGSSDEAAEFLPMYADPIVARRPDAQIEPIWLTDDTDDGSSVAWPEDPDGLGGLVIAGGWTPGYLDGVMSHQETISRLVRADIPYLGYSAGAVITAKHAIAGGWHYEGRQVANESASEGSHDLELRNGLALIGPSVDVHADTQMTLGRAMATLQAGQMSSVVAIDEATALVIDAVSGRTKVMGEGAVAWVQRAGDSLNVRYERASQ